MRRGRERQRESKSPDECRPDDRAKEHRFSVAETQLHWGACILRAASASQLSRTVSAR